MAADLALYAVKAGGRGSFRFYKRFMNEAVNDRRQIEMRTPALSSRSVSPSRPIRESRCRNCPA
jgi:predicted signal transduction protein with EAL and GGDEF domain